MYGIPYFFYTYPRHVAPHLIQLLLVDPVQRLEVICGTAER